MNEIYLDASATTRPYPEVISTIINVMQNHWHNPSSSYADDSRRIIETVRQQIADDINADPSEIIFTSGACEANSLAYRVMSYMYVVSSKLEHKSIECLNEYYDAMLVNNDNYGFIDLEELDCILNRYNNHKSLVSIHAANSEIGVIQDLRAISNITHKHGGIFHTDVTQLLPEQRVNVKELGIDLMSASFQKMHSDKGVGFLYIKDGFKLQPLILGGQEQGNRAGTYNTASIAGAGKALEITRLHNASENIGKLKNILLSKLLTINGTTLNGPSTDCNRLKNNISITIDGINAETLVTMCALNSIFLSKGSACNSYSPEPSKTLKAIGLSDSQALSTIRITLDEFNTEEEIDQAANIITKLVERLRNNET
jgi:cysteine desulfurase